LARAALESVAYQVRDVFDAMRLLSPAEALYADGGASREDTLMQFQADLIGKPVLRNQSTDLAALGTAYLAGLAVGMWRSLDEIAALPRTLDRFEPRAERPQMDALYAGWREAVARARLRVEGAI
jgi:glycerol kinase